MAVKVTAIGEAPGCSYGLHGIIASEELTCSAVQSVVENERGKALAHDPVEKAIEVAATEATGGGGLGGTEAAATFQGQAHRQADARPAVACGVGGWPSTPATAQDQENLLE